jgi:hypothetical protein
MTAVRAGRDDPRMTDARTQFSAKVNPIDAIGARPESPVVRVRDVLICMTGGSDVPTDELQAHLPIAFPLSAHFDPPDSPPVDLGRGLSIDRLAPEDAELVMHACMPRGHYFAPVVQLSKRYSFVRNVAIEEWREHPFRWDPDGVVYDALQLSRLVRDNADSTRFAARIADFEDGEQTVVYTLAAESQHAYRLRRDRDWLDQDEGAKLRDLLATYRRERDSYPRRLNRAIWRTEYAAWLKWADLRLPVIVGGLESLLKTERHGATSQFRTRVSALAAALGFDAITPDYCERLYDARSEWVHGTHVRLFASGIKAEQASTQADGEAAMTPTQRDAIAEIARLQDVLRRAVRRSIEDAEFRSTFADDDAIRARWASG